MKSLISPTIAIFMTAAISCGASAGTRTLVLSGRDLGANSSGSSEGITGVSLPKATSESIAVNLVLPKDYKKNTKVSLRARLTTVADNCDIKLAAASAIRFRPGKVVASVLGGGSGFTIAGSGTFSAPAVAAETFNKTFTLKPATLGTIQSQVAGDNILLVIAREATDAGDTCSAPVLISSIKVTYTTK
jgi:hypothetical protein